MKIKIEAKGEEVVSSVDLHPVTLIELSMMITEMERIKARLVDRVDNCEPDWEVEELED